MRWWDGPWDDNQKNKVRTDLKNDNQKKLQTKPRRERPEEGGQRSSPGLARGPGTSSSLSSQGSQRGHVQEDWLCPAHPKPHFHLYTSASLFRETATGAQGLSGQGAAWSYWFLGSSAENGVTTEELSNSQKVAPSWKVCALKTPPWGLWQILQCLILETNSTINLPQGLSLFCLHSVLHPACTDRKDHRKTYWEITSKNRKTAVQAHASLWNLTSTLLK